MAKERWGKSYFSDDFRDFVQGGGIRPGTSVRPVLEVINGELCHVLEWHSGSASKPSVLRVWLAHEKGMLPMKSERIMTGILAMSIDVKQAQAAVTEAGTIWFPARTAVRTGIPGLGSQTYETVVHKFLPGKPSDEALSTELPEGT